MNKEVFAQEIRNLRADGHRLISTGQNLLNRASALEDELSGGSGSSNSPLSQEQLDAIVNKRRQKALMDKAS